jgi:hypothetical protein
VTFYRCNTFTAPDDGWSVNSYIIELSTQLIVIDAQYMLPYAKEVVNYAQTLRKPIKNRVLPSNNAICSSSHVGTIEYVPRNALLVAGG